MSEHENNDIPFKSSAAGFDRDLTDGEYRYVPRHGQDDYADAHYEPVGESTTPPRYYTPPEKEAKASAEKPKHGIGAVGLICAVLAAALLGGFCGAGFTGARLNSRIEELAAELETLTVTARSGGTASAAAETASDSGSGVMSPAEIYAQATRQVVGVRTEITVTNFFGMVSSGAVSGSGFIISEDGYILTNYHVVEDAYNRRLDVEVITYDGTAYAASIIGVEPSNDIAVLHIDAEGLSAASFGDSDTLQVGDTVYAVGNPLGELEFSMSTGHVSALDRVISTQESESVSMFQIDAAVNEGNSGGPVYNDAGQVIGIVTAKYSSSGVEGLGFAIPANDANTISYDLVTKGYVSGKAFMGVSLNDRYDAMYSQYWGLPMGAYVRSVTPGSAADQAGLRADDIITAIGDYPVQEYTDVRSALRHFSAFDTTVVTVYRGDKELKLDITFDEQTPANS